MLQIIRNIRASVLDQQPLIHCITNPISITQCANAILAVGGRPIMAEHPREVAEITCSAKALMLNLGNITDARVESIRTAAATAQSQGLPILLDAVGVACSALRRNYAAELLKTVPPTVIKGNYSEIQALCRESHRSSGVDADPDLEIQTIDTAAITLARRYGSVILASGKIDIVTDGYRLIHIHNGTPLLSRITGTGCMLGALCATFLSAQSGLNAAAAACAVFGLCGELAETDRGTGTFFVNLMDALSTLTDADVEKKLKLEEIHIEEI